jgi:pimeloyl-ACP methyl ester carboxylesterase
MTLTMSPTFVLVPGVWQGGWAWQPVARRLREVGYAAVTVTLPGLADGDDRAGLQLSDAIDHVVAEIERRDLAEVVLVGQSWGGYVITGAAKCTDRPVGFQKSARSADLRVKLLRARTR